MLGATNVVSAEDLQGARQDIGTSSAGGFVSATMFEGGLVSRVGTGFRNLEFWSLAPRDGAESCQSALIGSLNCWLRRKEEYSGEGHGTMSPF